MLDTLWELSRVPALHPHLVNQALNEHLCILNESANREQVFFSFMIELIRKFS